MAGNDFLSRLDMPSVSAGLIVVDKIMSETAGPSLSGFLKDRLTQGKRLRPVLLMLAAGDMTSQDVLRAAAAVELIHKASKLHDDALDETVSSPAGYILGGDLLLNAGLSLAARQGIPVMKTLSETVANMIEGEYRQAVLGGAGGPEDKEYQAVCTLKTSSLFAAAAAIGGQLGGGSEKSIRALKMFSRCFGLAYQINDDITDGHFPKQQQPAAYAEARRQLRAAGAALSGLGEQAALEKFAKSALPGLS